MKIVFATFVDCQERLARVLEVARVFEENNVRLFVVGAGRAFGAIEDQFQDSFRVVLPPGRFSKDQQDEFMWQKNKLLQTRLERLQPDCMLLDGAEYAAKLAKRLSIKTISIDHLHFFNKARLSIPLSPGLLDQMAKNRNEIKSRSYQPNLYLLPLFFDVAVHGPSVKKIPPLVRRPIEDIADRYDGDSFLALGWPGIENELTCFQEVDVDIRVFLDQKASPSRGDRKVYESAVRGSEGQVLKRRKRESPNRETGLGNKSLLPSNVPGVEFHHMELQQWAEELGACKAVLLEGEHLSIAEAIYLKKPMLLIPKPGNLEQLLYAHHIEMMGFGEHHPRLTRAVLEGFLQRITRYRSALEAHSQWEKGAFGNTLFDSILEKIEHRTKSHRKINWYE